MRPYEVMIIFNSGSEGPEIQGVVDRATETIKSTGGTPGAIDRWGKRQFAYEVNHHTEGYYVLMEFSAPAETVVDLDRLLVLADEVLRHRILRRSDKPIKAAPEKVSKGKSSGKRTGVAA